MVQLHDSHAIVLLNAGAQPRQAREMVVAPAPQLASKSLSDRLDVRSTGHRASKAVLRPLGGVRREQAAQNLGARRAYYEGPFR